ncbi:MAG: VWA domain-containing protein [Myxococcaceae bacterium]
MRALVGSLAILMLLSSGCSDALIEKRMVDDVNVDDKLAVSGRVCTAVPDPSGFPVKVVLIVDQSGSMCISDPPGSQESPGFCEMYSTVPPGVTQPARVRALNLLLDQFANQPNVEVALVPFETNVKGTWPTSGGMGTRFARPDNTLRTRVNNLQAELGKGTDYQGALAYTYGLIASDIAATEQSTPEVLPRTKYVVVFLTDGVPFPRCAGNDNLTIYADDLNPDLTWADSLGAGDFCNQIDPMDPDYITGFVAGTDRNQNYQLKSYVKQIVDMKDAHNVGDIRVNTVLMFNEESVRNCGPICQDIYGLYARYPGPVPVADGPAAAHRIAQWTLQELATIGNGVYQEFNNFQGLAQLNLGVLDYSSLASRNVMKTLMLQALSSEPGPQGRIVDSDGDGVPDSLDNDFSHGTVKTNKFFADSDNDGFDDAFEIRHYDDGFRADVPDGRGCGPSTPIQPCTVADTDGDGLSQWVEEYLKSRQTLVDSDADGVPDGLEVKYGLDPSTRLIADIDTDNDTTSDADEFRKGSNPVVADNAYQEKSAYQYALTSEVQSDGRVCYDFKISNIQMVTPPNSTGKATQGYNLFKIWFGEAPESGVATDYGVWKAACFWAQYDPPSVRVPAGPEVAPLTDADFKQPRFISSPAQYDLDCGGISPVQGSR